jgi:dTDP-4-dehydrorhamnose 3,5-epimerase
MKLIETKIEGVALVEPQVFGDERGFFVETYRRSTFESFGIHGEFVQDNHSRSRRGTLRGIHFQVNRGAAKLVRCVQGAIFDVVVDLRRGSPTYADWQGFELTGENMRLLYVPAGFGHGFCVLSDWADVVYKQDAYYVGATETGIKYDDPDVGVEWPIPAPELQVSERDATAPLLSDVADDLPFVYVKET